MKESNERFGVVNVEMRTKYEKCYHIPFGYDYMTFRKQEAIAYCKALKADPRYKNFIVERIFDTPVAANFKEEIFRGGRNEKDN